jgi:hypothetical protein
MGLKAETSATTQQAMKLKPESQYDSDELKRRETVKLHVATPAQDKGS